MKKVTCMILSLIMIISLAPESVFATSTGASESYALSILNKPGTTFELSRGEYTYDVCDIWKEIDSDGTGELKFDQSFSVNINNAVDAYNNYLDTEYPNGERDYNKASEDNHNGSIFYVEARVLINNYDFNFSSKASYAYAPYGLDGEYNEGCGEWKISSYYDDLSDFFTMSEDGGVLNLSLDGTVKEIYEALKAHDETLGDVTINDLTFELRVSCEVEYRGSWGSTNYTELSFEAISHSLYDKHIYESASEYDTLSAIPITAPLTANVVPAYEGCYEPVKTEYSWYYEFIKEGEEEEENGEYKWYGYFERDESKESDVLTETAPSGTIYGIAYGKVDSDNNSITLDDILNEDNKDFINSFIGEKPRELGGKGQMFVGCDVTLTFEDGKQWVVCITKADYMSRLISPCMHACMVCGLCTVTDEMLPCNFDQMSYDITNVCVCEEPSVPEFEVTVEAESQMTIESTERIVNVVVEKIEVEETPTHSFIINTTEAVGADNVIALYNINVFDEAGFPYTLNQWYDEGEELTVSVPISIDDALALQSGEAALYHILADGTAEEVEGVTVVIDGESATMTFTSDSFSPFIIAKVTETGDDVVLGIDNGDGTYSLPDNVVGYYIGEDFVDAGKYTVVEGEVVTTVDFNVTMLSGAQVRYGGGLDENGKISTGNGLRFLATVDRSNFDAEGYGMKITAECSSAETIVDADKWQDDTTFTVALTDIAESNYIRKFTATPFVKVKYTDGEEKTIYGTQSVTRSIYNVSAGLLTNGEEYTDELIAVLNAYANQTGIRLVINSVGGDMKAHTAKYGDTLHFAVSDAEYDEASNSYSVILTAQGNAEIITDNNFWYDYIRINNNNSLVRDNVTVEKVEGNDKSVKVVLHADGLIQRPADSNDNVTDDPADDEFDGESD